MLISAMHLPEDQQKPCNESICIISHIDNQFTGSQKFSVDYCLFFYFYIFVLIFVTSFDFLLTFELFDMQGLQA